MRKLTSSELLAIQDLADSPLIEQISYDRHSNGLMRVTVISSLDASWNGVDALLDRIFPDSEYRGKAGVELRDGITSEYYSVDVDEETLINLCMKKTTPAGAVEGKTYHLDYTIPTAEVELIGPCSIEQIIKMEA